MFGEDVDQTPENAAKEAEKRGAGITIYIASTNQEQVGFLSQIFVAPLFRVLLMKGDDFFLESEGRYASMGIDRLANVLGAGQRFGFPSLVFDGGTAITYTAVDQHGKLLGGGISPGFSMRLESMNTGTSALPRINVSAVSKAVENAVNKEKPLQIFESSTNDAMIINMLSEVSNNARHVAKVWLEKVGTTDGGNSKRHIAVTGGAGLIMKELMQDKDVKIIEGTSDTDSLEVKYVKNLIHFGITAAIKLALSKGSKKSPPYTKDDERKPPSNGTQNASASITEQEVAEQETEKEVAEQETEKEVTEVSTSSSDTQHDAPEKETVMAEKEEGKKKDDKQSKSLMEELGISPVQKKKRERVTSPSVNPVRRTKRVRTPKPSPSINKSFDPESFVGHRIAKVFRGTLYFGSVIEYVAEGDREPFWHVKYDDDDEEGLEKNELMKAIKLQKTNSDVDVEVKKVDV